MKPAPTPRWWPLALLLAVTVGLSAALTTGGTAYTKRITTKLLAEPKPMAAATGEVAFGKALTISTVQGAWLQVSGEGAAGWVFNGNLSATKPDVGTGVDGKLLVATETSASAAARPLDEVVIDYANRHGMADAQSDMNWLNETAKAITDEDIDAFLREKKKGEYK